MERLLRSSTIVFGTPWVPVSGFGMLIMDEAREAAQERRREEEKQRSLEWQIGAFTERVCKHGIVPIERVERGLIAPVCPGPVDGTIVIRFLETGAYRVGNGTRATVRLDGAPYAVHAFHQEAGAKAWRDLSMHKRLALFAAVQHRTPKGGPR